MGAYIKNFKMPPPGKYRACVIVDEFGARITVDVATSYADHDLRVDPIFPVPTHGRTIDADALYEKFARLESEAMNALKTTNPGSVNWIKWSAILMERTGYKHDIADAPTIIPAEDTDCHASVRAGSQ